jgi:hypothetical protein
MNRFAGHHRQLIRFGYSCFDRIICNGLVPEFHASRCGTIVWFLRNQRHVETLNRAYFAKVAGEYHEWLTAYAQQTGLAIVEPEKSRREDWVEPYYRQLGNQPGIAVILKARESEGIVVHFAKTNRTLVQQRFVNLYYFYLNDADGLTPRVGGCSCVCVRIFLSACASG